MVSFLAELGDDPARLAGLAGIEDLEAHLTKRCAEGRAAWPTVQIDDAEFVAYLAARSFEGLADLNAADLYVACGCARGDADALKAIEARYFPLLDAALGQMRLPDARIDDVKQGLRRLLFVGDEAAPPRIVEYTGRGELRGWLRVSAVRAALKLLRRDKKEVLVEEVGDEALLRGGQLGEPDPELLYVKKIFRAQFRLAFQEALDSLTDRERLLLRQHVVDDLSIDDLAPLYRVHRATAARWLTQARETLLTRTRRNLMHTGKMSESDCDSVLRLVRSQLDLTIRRRLEEAAGPGAGPEPPATDRDPTPSA